MEKIRLKPFRSFFALFLICIMMLGMLPGCTVANAADTGQEGQTELSAYQAEVLRLVNEERAAYGLSALSISSLLTAAAQQRASELPQRMDSSHLRPDGREFYTVLEDFGISYTKAGENLARGQRTPAEVVQDWMNSAGHRQNILNSQYRSIGIGIYTDSAGTIYWVQEFTD